jgi:glycosyltransferase involved in cell wall biosynthesis
MAPLISLLASRGTSGTISAKYAEALIVAGARVRIFQSQSLDGNEYRSGVIRTSADIVHLPMWRRSLWRPTYYFRRLQLLSSDIIIAEDPELLEFAIPFVRLSGARLVYMPFEYYPGASNGTPTDLVEWAGIERRYAPYVGSWIMLGDKIAEIYADTIAPRESVHVVYAGWPRSLGCGTPRLRDALGVGPEVRTILYQGGITEARGLWDVLDAMPLMPEWVHFAVVGMGQIDRLRQDVAQRGLSRRVHVLDAVPQGQLVEYSLDADLGIIPIRNICESYDLCSPGKLFECIGAGLPLVVSRLRQLEWYVQRHGIGEVFEPQVPSEIARAVMSLLGNDSYRQQCRDNIRRLQDTEACWEVQAIKLQRAVLGPPNPQKSIGAPMVDTPSSQAGA